ncbi:MAG: hypothetical protein HQM16_12740 [Deltaproteobacteria bacterium]|nr:hypothetical protein [Deltaproteobacteria bacterium]
MHLEILVEDLSGRKTLEILVPKIIGKDHTFRVIAYKGIGRIPKNLRGKSDVQKRMLLEQLPRLLRGYGKTYHTCPDECAAAVIVVCDLDDKCLKTFRSSLLHMLNQCKPRPKTRFCVAVEEVEAWLLGDLSAVKKAYPKAREAFLKKYKNDCICGTWELLADAVYPGGASALSEQGWQVVGTQKTSWASSIAVHIRVANNTSPSFNYFVRKLRELTAESQETGA